MSFSGDIVVFRQTTCCDTQPKRNPQAADTLKAEPEVRMDRDVCLTSAPWDRVLLLKAGESSADRRGVRPSSFSCSPEGDFGTVHTGTPSAKTARRGLKQVWSQMLVLSRKSP